MVGEFGQMNAVSFPYLAPPAIGSLFNLQEIASIQWICHNHLSSSTHQVSHLYQCLISAMDAVFCLSFFIAFRIGRCIALFRQSSFLSGGNSDPEIRPVANPD